MINVPVTDTLAFRLSGALTSRDGFDYNTVTQRRVNDRDLWSTRAIVAWEPSDRFRANIIWQHFEEDDNRSRTGKQLCTRDPGPATRSEEHTSELQSLMRISYAVIYFDNKTLHHRTK